MWDEWDAIEQAQAVAEAKDLLRQARRHERPSERPVEAPAPPPQPEPQAFIPPQPWRSPAYEREPITPGIERLAAQALRKWRRASLLARLRRGD